MCYDELKEIEREREKESKSDRMDANNARRRDECLWIRVGLSGRRQAMEDLYMQNYYYYYVYLFLYSIVGFIAMYYGFTCPRMNERKRIKMITKKNFFLLIFCVYEYE